MKINLYVCLILASLALPALAGEIQCQTEYERGKREIGAYAEMAGIIEGTIYGYTLVEYSQNICLSGTAKEKVQAIAKAFASESFMNKPILMDDVPTKDQALEFLRRFFPCH